MSRNGSSLQLIHAGVGTAAMTTLPWSLAPSVLVPFFLIAHAIVFAQLRANFSENNRNADFDERLQSSALTPAAAWPTGAQSTSSTGRRDQRRLIRSLQR